MSIKHILDGGIFCRTCNRPVCLPVHDGTEWPDWCTCYELETVPLPHDPRFYQKATE